MPSRRILGLPSEARISAARAVTSGVRDSSSRLGKSTEIGTALARTVRLVEGSSPGGVKVTVSALVVMPSSRLQERRKFSASAVRWKPRKSAPSRPSTRARRHGSCEKSSTGGERDVVEPADANIGSHRPDHRRNELQLVVMHPDRGTRRGHLYDGLGEALVDPPVGVPPVAVEGRRDDHVMEDRPERVVAETLVVLLDLGG